MIAIKKVWFDKSRIFVELNDSKIIGTPINWYSNLSKGTKEQMEKYELDINGQWIHWEELDEDLSVQGFLTFSKDNVKAK